MGVFTCNVDTPKDRITASRRFSHGHYLSDGMAWLGKGLFHLSFAGMGGPPSSTSTFTKIITKSWRLLSADASSVDLCFEK
jgi:hypothetical protein